MSRPTGWSHSRASSAATSWVASFDPDDVRPNAHSMSDSAGEVESDTATETEHRIGTEEILLHRTLEDAPRSGRSARPSSASP